MGIDWGEREVGIALSDPLQIVATGFTTLKYHSREELVREIGKIIKDKDIREVVVGLPRRTDGKMGWSEERVREFVEKLKVSLSIPVKMFDERYSTALAKKFSGRKEELHKISAEILLQSYLDYLHERENP